MSLLIHEDDVKVCPTCKGTLMYVGKNSYSNQFTCSKCKRGWQEMRD